MAESWKKDAIPVDEKKAQLSSWRKEAIPVTPQEEPGILEKYVAPVGRFVDRYTGAPARAGLMSLVQGHEPISAAYRQFGEDPELAPTGKDIATRLGAPETSAHLGDLVGSINPAVGMILSDKNKEFLNKPTVADVAGFGVDIAADPTNIIPGAKMVKGGLGLIGKGIQTGAKGASIASDIATGTKIASKGVETAGNIAETAAHTVKGLLSPQRAMTYAKDLETAKKFGIPAEALGSSIEFGPGSSITRLERALREGPTGEKLIESWKTGKDTIDKALDTQVKRIGGTGLVDEINAGRTIREGFDRAQQKMFDSMDLMYGNVHKYAPGLYINKDDLAKLSSKLNGIKKQSIGLAKRAIDATDKEQSAQMLRAIEGIEASKGNFKQTVEQMQRIGRKAFSDKPTIGQIPIDRKKMQELYHTISDAVLNTVRKDINPEFADEIVKNNKTMSDFFSHRSNIKSALESGKADESLFRNLIGNGDSKKIESLKALLDPNDFRELKNAFVSNLIKSNENGISFKATKNAIDKNRVLIKSMLDPKEISDLEELVNLGSRYGEAMLSSSGTGASNSFRDMAKNVFRGAADEQVLNKMKEKARFGGEPIEFTNKGLLPAPGGADSIPSNKVMPKGGLLGDKKRGGFEKRLKAAQSIAPSTYKEEENQRR